MSEPNTLSIHNLCCIRGERTLFSDLKASVSSGQCLHVIGANGCGKTSLLKIICGLNLQDEGEILWNDIPIRETKEYLNDSAFIAHKDALKNELSAVENLRFYQELNLQEPGTENFEKEDQLDDCLTKMQILRCADLLAQQLSFGQRRRLSFARLLLRTYKLWILDEPFTGIDTQGRAVIESLCLDHLQNGGMIILTHHQSLKDSELSAYLTELVLDQYQAVTQITRANDE